MPDPFGRAIRDHYRGEREEPLVDRDGAESRIHDIEGWYFCGYEGDEWVDSWLDGPLLDVGAGAGRHTLYYQQRFETVAIEESDYLVEMMVDRGVEDARRVDMFELPEAFDADRFRSVFCYGTQVGLVASLAGLRQFLADLAAVTDDEGTAVLHNYAPEKSATDEVFAYRPDPTPGLAYRVYHERYDGEVGRTLLFRLFSLDRLGEAAADTPWRVAEARYVPEEEPTQWLAALEKRPEEPQET